MALGTKQEHCGRQSCGRRPREGVLLDGFVAGIEGGFEEEDSGDATGHFLDVANFVFGERTAEKRLFAVGSHFLMTW